MLPTLELLQRTGHLDDFVHRHVLQPTEFVSYLEARRADRSTRSYGTIYFAFHGTEAGLDVGGQSFTFDRLANLLGPLPSGVVHLGSCSVLNGDRRGAERFLDATGADLLSGYERPVDWLDSAALDLAWLGYLQEYSRTGDAVRYFRKRYQSSIEHLRWQVVRR